MTALPKVGNNAMPSWDIGLDDVFVPHEALLGKLNDGFSVLGSTLAYSRASLAATCLGSAQSLVKLCISHLRERRQF
ncbi:MAG: acyl-CoA dehydrogenase family protein, partial [Betaproteobacteria bacterium]